LTAAHPCEYGSTVVGLEMLRAVTEESAEEDRKIAVVHAALGTLSYSELEAISLIFQELHGTDKAQRRKACVFFGGQN